MKGRELIALLTDEFRAERSAAEPIRVLDVGNDRTPADWRLCEITEVRTDAEGTWIVVRSVA